jgi:hypothetical protein
VYPHLIRLRGPWECEPLTGDPPPAARRITLPCRWADGGLPGYAGQVRFRRRFGSPTNLDDTERVWLTFAGIEGSATVALNGQPLPFRADGEYEITTLLRPRNELVVEIDGPETGGLWGEVALEIRRTAYLRGVRCRVVAGRLIVEGEVAGFAERPLELYVLVERATVAYGTCLAGGAFRVASEALSVTWPLPVRVDLVDGATVWYTLERMVDRFSGESGF